MYPASRDALVSLVNGQTTSLVSIRDRGLAYGDGVFETMRLEGGVIPLWPFHRERLLDSCERLQLPLDGDQLSSDLSLLLKLAAERSMLSGLVKLIVTRGAGGRGYQPAPDLEPNRVLTLSLLPSVPTHFRESGVRVRVCKHRLPDNPALAGIKHLNKLDYVLASLEWYATDFQEGLLLDSVGRVVEAGSRNVFVVRDGMLFTPHLGRAGVAGVLRRRIMESYAAALGFQVEETDFDLDFLADAEEVFLTNSITGVWPVAVLAGDEIGELHFPDNGIGRRLQQLFENDLGIGREKHDA